MGAIFCSRLTAEEAVKEDELRGDALDMRW